MLNRNLKPWFLLLIILFCLVGKNYGQWIQTNGPYACNVERIVFANNNLFASTNENGINRSSDNGDSWSFIHNGPAGDIVCTGANLFISILNNIYHSADSGATWSNVSTGLQNTNYYFLGAVGTTVFTMGYGVLYMSTNNGGNWVLANNGLNLTLPTSIVSIGTDWYLGTENGVFKSVNSGISWTPTSFPAFMHVYSIVTDGINLFAGSDNGGVYISSDGGNSWTAVNNGLTSTFINSLLIKGNNLFAATREGIFISTNNGSSWSPVNSGLENPYVNTLATNGTDIFAGTGGTGIFKSTDNGNSWFHASDSLDYAKTFSVIEHNGNLFAGIEWGGVFTSQNNGNTWEPVNGGLNFQTVNSLISYNNKIYAGAFNGAFVSDNNGNTWSDLGISTSIQQLHASNDTIFAATYSGLYLSNDSGVTWQLKNNGLTNNDLRKITTIGSTIFVATYGSPGGGVFRSIDNADSWTNVNDSLTHVFDMVSYGNALYVSSNIGGLYKSTDLGDTWNIIYPNNVNVASIQFNGNTMYIGVASGSGSRISVSTDFGTTWFNSNPLPYYYGSISDMLINGTAFYLATGHGVVINSNFLCTSFSNISPIACDIYNSPSGNYTWDSSGVYVDTLLNAAGCDSLIAIDLTIAELNSVLTYTGSTSFCRGDSLPLYTSPAYTSWQWYRNGIPILVGGTSDSYIARRKGNYYCVVSDSLGCIDTTNTVSINVPCLPPVEHERVGDETDESLLFEISQTNPEGTFTFSSSPGNLSVYNLYGQLILKKYISELQTEINFPALHGLYLFSLQTGSQQVTRKIYIQ